MVGRLLFAIAVLALGSACKATRAGYESPNYKTVSKDGAFEIRHYPSMTIASTSMDDTNPTEGSSFMNLFDYISKGNEQGEKIAMTTPVFIDKGSKKMSFIVPTETAAASAPKPSSPSVRLGTMRGGEFAAYRYSGAWNPERTSAAETKLRAWTKTQRVRTAGDAIVAHYDPPFTPKPLRRNEVLLRVRE